MTEEIKNPEARPDGQEPENTPAPLGEPETGIGDMMKEGTRKAIATVVVLLLIVAYLAGLAYAETHSLNMLRSGVAPDLLMWAYLGMFTLGILAIALPLALHYWAFDPVHRIATYFCYGIDLALLGINSFTDFSTNEGQQLVQWAQFYKDYVMPSTPVIALVIATVLLLLDPHARAFVMRQTLRATMMQKQADLVIRAANNPTVTATVNAAAQQEVERALTELFGYRVTSANGYVMDTNAPTRPGGLAARFFGWLSTSIQSLMQPAPSDNTPSPSQPSDLPNEPQDEPKP